jgi:hypothetical protein
VKCEGLTDETIYKSYYALNEEGYFEFSVILVVLDESLIQQAMKMLSRRIPEFDANLRILIGCIDYDEESEEVSEFRLFDKISLRKRM